METLGKHSVKHSITPIEVLSRAITNAKSRDQVLRVLRNIPENYFMSGTHYYYYERFLRPKLTFEKTVKGYFVDYYIVLTEHYIVIEIVYRNKFLREIAVHSYVIGQDHSSRKLFVNKAVSTAYPPIYATAQKISDLDNVKIYKGLDTDVRELLGFFYDVEYDGYSSELVMINVFARYRVQGEIVLDVFTDASLESHLYNSGIHRILRSIYAERIASMLINIGLNARVNNEYDVVIPGVIHGGFRNSRQVNMYCRAIKYVLKSMGLEFDGDQFYSNDASFKLTCDRSSFPMTYPYADLIIHIHDISDPRLEAIIRNDIREQVSKLTPQDVSITLGRHYVKLRNVIPATLSYTPPERLYLGLIEPPVITIDLQSFLVNSESEITIKHHEHGEVKIRFSRDLVDNHRAVYVRIETTRVSREYTSEQNRIVLKRIVNEMPELWLRS